MSTQVELVVDAHAVIGEGALWNSAEQVLYWVDIMGNKLHVHDPSGESDRVMDIGQPVGTVVVRASGGLMLALKDGFAAFDPASGELDLLHDPEAHLPENRFNDGKCDPAGRFWAGTMAIDPVEGAGALYCMDTDLSVRKVLGGVSISNGIVWSLDGTRMYFIDSLRYDVQVYDYDVETGTIDDERIAFRVPREVGLPDGMAIDAEGMLWIAHFDGAKVCRWHPDSGEILQTIRAARLQDDLLRLRRPGPGNPLHHQRFPGDDGRREGAGAPRRRALRGPAGVPGRGVVPVRRVRLLPPLTICRSVSATRSAGGLEYP